LTAPSWFGSEPFAAVVRRFRTQYPAVQLDLHLSDGVVDILDQGLDMALRVTRHLQTPLVSRYLGPVHFHLVAAPSLVPRSLSHPSSLQGFPWL